MVDENQAPPPTDAAPLPDAPPPNAGDPFAQPYLEIVDRFRDLWAHISSEPATRAERIAIALLGMHPPAPGDQKPTFAADLAKMAHDIATELDKLEAAVDEPQAANDTPADPPQT